MIYIKWIYSDPVGCGLSENITTGIGGSNTSIQNLEYQWDSIGNLEWREDKNMRLIDANGVKETFGYDNLNRLTSTHVSGGGLPSSVQTLEMQYYANGNIKYKSGVGYYNYGQNGAGPHALSSISQAEYAQRAGDANGDGQINSADIYLTVDDILTRQEATGRPDCNQDASVNVLDLVCMRNNASDSANSGGTVFEYDANGNMQNDGDRYISWSAANKPLEISRGNESVEFRYAANGSRYYRQDNAANGETTKTYYLGGLIELVKKSNGETLYKNYINAGGNTFAVYNVADSQQQMRYLHKDHLGSISTITDEIGNPVERFHYDAFGKRIAGSWDNGKNNFVGDFVSSLTTTRGYTGHEMMANVGLINMNARIYDPNLGRFLSADSKVVYPYSTQGFNRYSYTDNNPLSRTDPSGHGWLSDKWKEIKKGVKQYGLTILSIAIVIFAPYAIGVAGQLTLAQSMAVGFASGFVGSGGDFKAGLMGMAFAGITYGIGSTTSPGSFGNVASHAVVGGVRSRISGGSFKDGFLSGGFTAAIGPALKNSKLFVSSASKVAAAAIIGGTASVIGGGKFANGAITGAFVMAMNHMAHEWAMEYKLNKYLKVGAKFHGTEFKDLVATAGSAGLSVTATSEGLTYKVGDKLFLIGADELQAAGVNMAPFSATVSSNGDYSYKAKFLGISISGKGNFDFQGYISAYLETNQSGLQMIYQHQKYGSMRNSMEMLGYE